MGWWLLYFQREQARGSVDPVRPAVAVAHHCWNLVCYDLVIQRLRGHSGGQRLIL